MYKCTDCGKEYKEKPEYCDCGNTNFEVINIDGIVNNQKSERLGEGELNDKQSVMKHSPKRKENIRQSAIKHDSGLKYKNKSDYDPISIIIFIICIILSILSIIYIGNTSQTEKPANNTEEKKEINIPSINDLWKEGTIKQTQEIKEQKPKEEPVKKTVKAPEIKKNTQEKLKKTQTTVKKNQPQQNKVKPTNKTNQSVQTNQPPKNKTPNVQANDQIPSLPKLKLPLATPSIDPKIEKKELLKYKIDLRNKITSEINFKKIVGDGQCSVTFKIDSNGNLINRKFEKQSSNDSINNEVYNAIMKTPAYNPPPTGYKNEILTFKLKIYGNSFEIDLI